MLAKAQTLERYDYRPAFQLLRKGRGVVLYSARGRAGRAIPIDDIPDRRFGRMPVMPDNAGRIDELIHASQMSPKFSITLPTEPNLISSNTDRVALAGFSNYLVLRKELGPRRLSEALARLLPQDFAWHYFPVKDLG